MTQAVVPMFHVPDVAATGEWYKSVGFTIVHTDENDGEINCAKLAYEGGEIMVTAGGKTSEASRRDVDLYIVSNKVDQLYEKLQSSAEVVEGLHDTFYGMREFIIRDVNGFWLTFGQPVQL
jgi:uncharacterized glyoxalase superfamily protein PhnB